MFHQRNRGQVGSQLRAAAELGAKAATHGTTTHHKARAVGWLTLLLTFNNGWECV
jgi:hypothetical protein